METSGSGLMFEDDPEEEIKGLKKINKEISINCNRLWINEPLTPSTVILFNDFPFLLLYQRPLNCFYNIFCSCCC